MTLFAFWFNAFACALNIAIYAANGAAICLASGILGAFAALMMLTLWRNA